MQTLLSKLEIKTCQSQKISCKKRLLQALCIDPDCIKNRNLCINCIKDHEDHSMIDYAQLIDLLELEEKSNNEYKKLSQKVEKQFIAHKSIILKELEDQEQKLRFLMNQVRSQYTTYDIFQQLSSNNQKLTEKQINLIGTRLSVFLKEIKQGEREFYEIKQVEFEKTDQYLSIQSILSRLTYSTHFLTQSELEINKSLQIKPLDFYQQFTYFQNSMQFSQIYDTIPLQSQENLRKIYGEKTENLGCLFNKSIQQLKKNNFYWSLSENDQLKFPNIIKFMKPSFKYPIEIDGHQNQIAAVAISQNEVYIASGDWDGLIVLWKLQKKQKVREFKSASYVMDLSFSNDNKLLAAAQFSQPYEILIYVLTNMNSNAPKFRLSGHTSTIWRIQFMANSEYIISGSQDETFKIWELRKKAIVFDKNLFNWVNGVSVSSNQLFISVCCKGGQAYLFDSQKFECLTEWLAHQETAYCTTFTPDSKMLLTSYKEIKLWSITELLSNNINKIPLKIFKGNKWFWNIKLIHNPQILIGNNDKICIWNLKTDQLICKLDIPGGYQYANDQNFVITQNLQYIITGGKNCKLKFYELKDI